MKKRKILTIIFILILLIIIGAILYIEFNTIIFKGKDEIKKDILNIQEEISNSVKKIKDEGKDVILGNEVKELDIDNKLYKKQLGIKNGELYVKKDASDKVKEIANELGIGIEKVVRSKDGVIILENTLENSELISYKLSDENKSDIQLTICSAGNQCESSYEIGSIKNYMNIENGKDDLIYTPVISNTEYTVVNDYDIPENIVFEFDKNYKFISYSKINTSFKTKENTRYIKIITESKDNEGEEVHYSVVIGTEPTYDFFQEKANVSISKNLENVRIPLFEGKTIIYIENGELECSYIEK